MAKRKNILEFPRGEVNGTATPALDHLQWTFTSRGNRPKGLTGTSRFEKKNGGTGRVLERRARPSPGDGASAAVVES